jgi:hypothetical protein
VPLPVAPMLMARKQTKQSRNAARPSPGPPYGTMLGGGGCPVISLFLDRSKLAVPAARPQLPMPTSPPRSPVGR